MIILTRCRTKVFVVAMLALLSSAIPTAVHAQVRVAVMNFENNSTFSYWGDGLGRAAADELVTQLFRSGEFSVIERAQLEALLAEQDLGASGAVDTSTAARIGQLLGAQLMLTGSITQFSIERTSGGLRSLGASVSRAESIVDVRLVNTTTGEIMLAESGEGRKTFGGLAFRGNAIEREFDAGTAQEALRPAIEQVVEKIADQADRFASLAPVTPPAPSAQIVGANDGSIYINQGEDSGVTVGQRFSVVRVIDEIRDADGTLLDRITDQVGVLEVTRVLSQSAICTVVEGEAVEGDQINPL